ncbi:tubulin-specific chaperone Rbl2 [Purpureocillium lilacinum]|uniref:Tubulin-specific chaperone A n=1 Tax=Purpureocillium lilacinum TaxID=33203 RepID=A0A2U3EKB9_PURLI|nr:tubulin-specific chaperone Rbl2 [Purpureocillium lilacinum]
MRIAQSSTHPQIHSTARHPATLPAYPPLLPIAWTSQPRKAPASLALRRSSQPSHVDSPYTTNDPASSSRRNRQPDPQERKCTRQQSAAAMPAPSPLAIASGSVQRLLKEEASYHKELAQQEAQVKALEERIKASGAASEDGNDEFMLKQQVRKLPTLSPPLPPSDDEDGSPSQERPEQTKSDGGRLLEQTKAVFGPLKERIANAVTKLEEQIAASEESNTNAADLEAAKAVLAQAKAA